MSGFIPLSVPNFGEKEAAYAAEAITSGWVSTSGAKVSEFEEALAAYVGMPRAVAANSAAINTTLTARNHFICFFPIADAPRIFGLFYHILDILTSAIWKNPNAGRPTVLRLRKIAFNLPSSLLPRPHRRPTEESDP